MQRKVLFFKNILKFHNSLLLILLIVTGSSLAGYQSSSSPEQVVTEFYKATDKNDTDTVTRLIHIPKNAGVNSTQVKGLIMMIVGSGHEQLQRHKGIKNLKIDKVNYSDDKKAANVYVILEYKDGENDTYDMGLVNEDGNWLISLD